MYNSKCKDYNRLLNYILSSRSILALILRTLVIREKKKESLLNYILNADLDTLKKKLSSVFSEPYSSTWQGTYIFFTIRRMGHCLKWWYLKKPEKTYRKFEWRILCVRIFFITVRMVYLFLIILTQLPHILRQKSQTVINTNWTMLEILLISNYSHLHVKFIGKYLNFKIL